MSFTLPRERLLHWYDRSRRDLPWRHEIHPYRTWISEVMLQQTRVEAVIDAFHRFLSRFPGVAELAAAPLDEVLALWSGLGYYRRARLLHQGARHLLEHHQGILPANLAELRKVPGIGPYTAGAILSIAYGVATPLVDGNVERVLTRFRALPGNPRVSPLKRDLWLLAEKMVEGERPGDWNQALMELGALVCLPARPRCQECPWEDLCEARAQGNPERFPELPPRKKARPQRLVALSLPPPGEVSGDRLLCFQRSEEERLMPGLWELPTIEISPGEDPGAPLSRLISERTGLRLQLGEEVSRVRHSILDRAITLELRTGTLVSGRSHLEPIGWAFLTPEERRQRGFSSMYRKALERHDEEEKARGLPLQPPDQ